MSQAQAPPYNLNHPGIIGPFVGQYRFLSNFYLLPNFEWGGRRWKTLEHAYQASKCVSLEDATPIWTSRSPQAAKAIGRQVELVPDWEERKVPLMYELLAEKFADLKLRAQLMETEGFELVEINNHGDKFWGVAPHGYGHNHLGLLLMMVREDIRAAVEAAADVDWLVGL